MYELQVFKDTDTYTNKQSYKGKQKHDYDEETNHNTVKQIKKIIYKSNKQFSNVTMYLGLAIKSHSLLRPLFVCPEGSLISLFRTSSHCLSMVLL